MEGERTREVVRDRGPQRWGERHPRLRGDKNEKEERQKNGSDGERRQKGKERPCEERDRDKERETGRETSRESWGDGSVEIEGNPEEADGVGQGLAPEGPECWRGVCVRDLSRHQLVEVGGEGVCGRLNKSGRTWAI